MHIIRAAYILHYMRSSRCCKFCKYFYNLKFHYRAQEKPHVIKTVCLAKPNA